VVFLQRTPPTATLFALAGGRASNEDRLLVGRAIMVET